MSHQLLIIQPSYYRSKADRAVFKARHRSVVPLTLPYLAALTPADWNVTLLDAWADVNSAEPGRFLKKWCAEEFGAAAPLLQEYYRAYFQAPARYGEHEDETVGDNYYHTAGRGLLLGLLAGDENAPIEGFRGVPKSFNLKEIGIFLAKITQEADPRWQEARLLAEKAKPFVPADRRDFFQAHVLSQVDIHLHSNRMLMHLAQAAADLHGAGQSSQISAAWAEGAKKYKTLCGQRITASGRAITRRATGSRISP